MMSDGAPATVTSLSPLPETSYRCPHCDQPLVSEGWRMPGMRPLVELSCPDCGRDFFGDLPSGNAITAATLLHPESGTTYQESANGDWFAKWLRESYRERVDGKYGVSIESRENERLRRPAFLNCIDRLYGHALLKLLNAQRFVDATDYDVVVVVQRNLRWLVPDGVAAVATVDVPLGSGYVWDDGLAAEFDRLVGDAEEVFLCNADPHPHPSTFDIERFTGVEPRSVEADDGDSGSPTVTYVWRDDRFWSRLPPWGIVDDWLESRVPDPVRESTVAERVGSTLDEVGRRIQRRRVIRLESALRSRYPGLEFAVAGVAEQGPLPARIEDRRTPTPDADDERRLCEQYAESSVVVGVHGSNMLLPSAHARSTVELVPTRRWGNLLQDILVRDTDPYRALYNTRLLPVSTSSTEVSAVVQSLIDDRAAFERAIPGPVSDGSAD